MITIKSEWRIYKPDSTGLYFEIQQIFQLIFSKARLIKILFIDPVLMNTER